MPRESIASDSTLADLNCTLTDPERHVANVLHTMAECRREHGNAHVRIGITGEGKAPFHKVLYRAPDGQEHLFGSYFGRNKDEKYQVHEHTWSTNSMSFEEVQHLLGEIRGYQQRQSLPEASEG
jgi:hypothetical protein